MPDRDIGHAPLPEPGAAPSVRILLVSIPENLTLVRGMLGGFGDSLGMDPELLDDVKTAVSEAANNVVMHAYSGEAGPLELELYARTDAIEAFVRDQGVGMDDLALVGERLRGVGLPVIEALSEQASFSQRPGGGTEVRMVFSAKREGRPLYGVPPPAVPDEDWTHDFTGDAVVSVSPLSLLPAVLGRLARALAATARFSLDRFSDVYLVTDALSAYAIRGSSSNRIGFVLRGSPRRLEITIGLCRPGSAERLRKGSPGPSSPLLVLSDELRGEAVGDAELMTVVMVDHRQ